jgi:tyrosine-protein kinase Etk/Wzc
MSDPNSTNGSPSSPRAEGATLQQLWQTLVRRRWWVLSVAAAVLLGTVVWTLRQAPVYRSASTLQIEKEGGAGPGLLSDIPALPGVEKGGIGTEMAVLRSRILAETVADTLALQVRVLKPNAPRSEVVRVVEAPRTVRAGVYRLERGEDGSFAASIVEDGAGPLPERIVPGQPFRLGGATLVLADRARGRPLSEVVIELQTFREAVEQLRSDLTISRPDLDAQVVSVDYRSTDPVLAAGVPNYLAGNFIRYKTRGNQSELSNTVGFLREQVEGYDRQLRDAESELRAFRESAKVVSIPDQASEQVKRLAALEARRDEINSEREALRSLLERVRQPATAGGPSQYRQLAAFPSFFSNRAVQDVLQSIITLENQRAELLVRRTPQNTDVLGIEQRIGELEGQLHQTARSYLQSLDSQAESLNTTMARFDSEIEVLPAREVRFAQLQRQQKLLEEIYTLLQTRLKEAEIQEAANPSEVRVLDSALVPVKPVSPRLELNLALGLVLGLMLGLGTALGREMLDTKVRDKEDAEAIAVGMPVLGMIPSLQGEVVVDAHLANGNGNGNGRKATKIRLFPQNQMIRERLVARHSPRSPASEAYRALRTSISFSAADVAPRVLVVTSAMPGDGKSTSAANLAITLAQQGTRTLLVDADLRRGLLHEVLEAKQQPGFTNVLHRRVPLADAVQVIGLGDGEQLHFLASGVFPPNPAELLGSEQMHQVLAQMKDEYEVIVFDAPPLNLVTDAAMLGRIADATLLVTRVGITDRRALQHAASQLRHLRVPVSGLVVNDVDVKGMGYYGYGKYAYGAAPK